MARATNRKVAVEKITVVTKQIVVLELTPAEAQTLSDLVHMVGGDPKKSRRKYTQNILRALQDVGINSPDSDNRHPACRYNAADIDRRSHITFDNSSMADDPDA